MKIACRGLVMRKPGTAWRESGSVVQAVKQLVASRWRGWSLKSGSPSRHRAYRKLGSLLFPRLEWLPLAGEPTLVSVGSPKGYAPLQQSFALGHLVYFSMRGVPESRRLARNCQSMLGSQCWTRSEISAAPLAPGADCGCEPSAPGRGAGSGNQLGKLPLKIGQLQRYLQA